MDQQVGGLENVITYKATDNQAGGSYTQYTPTGVVEKTGTQQEVKSGLKEFALGAAVLFGLPTLLNAGAATGAAATVGTTGLTTAELAQLDLALGGAGGTTGATTLANALMTGAPTVATTALTGGSGLITGANAGITAESVASQLAAAGTTPLTAAEIATLTAQDLAIGGGALAGTPPATIPGLLTPAATTTAATALTPAATTAATTTAATTAATTTAANTAATAAATGLTTAKVAELLKIGLTTAQIANLFSTGATTAAGLLQQQTSKEAAQAAQAKIDVETAAAKQAAQFRPVGMTTRFGTSQFVIDPKTGQLTSAGYTLDPQAKNAQDRLVRLAEQGLQQAEGAQAQFAPLQAGAQSLFGLGQGYLNAQTDPRLAQIASQYLGQSPESKRLTALGGDYLTQSPESKMLTSLGSRYIAQSPEQVAQNYLNQQMALLQPGRELELANLQNRLQQQGRGGLSVAQGGTLGATTPELQALYNARATQEAQLAANAQQAGQQQVQFGAGLVGTGQQLGIQGQQFGAGLIGTGQQLGMAGQQFGMDTLARQQALEQQRIGFGSGLLSQGSGLLGQYYAGQQAAYAPYTTALGGVQNLEALAQQPFNTSLALAQQQAQAGANVGQLGLRGAEQSVALATGRAATTNPYATLLGGAGASDAFGRVVGNLFGSTPTNALDFGSYGKGDAGFQKMLEDIYG